MIFPFLISFAISMTVTLVSGHHRAESTRSSTQWRPLNKAQPQLVSSPTPTLFSLRWREPHLNCPPIRRKSFAWMITWVLVLLAWLPMPASSVASWGTSALTTSTPGMGQCQFQDLSVWLDQVRYLLYRHQFLKLKFLKTNQRYLWLFFDSC